MKILKVMVAQECLSCAGSGRELMPCNPHQNSKVSTTDLKDNVTLSTISCGTCMGSGFHTTWLSLQDFADQFEIMTLVSFNKPPETIFQPKVVKST